MNLLRQSDDGFAGAGAALVRDSSLFDPGIEQRTREIVDAVAARGDAGLAEFTARFNGRSSTPSAASAPSSPAARRRSFPPR
ncbi:MAG: hypothetical protein ACKVYV_18335 [Limisphaerales bacterium]